MSPNGECQKPSGLSMCHGRSLEVVYWLSCRSVIGTVSFMSRIMTVCSWYDASHVSVNGQYNIVRYIIVLVGVGLTSCVHYVCHLNASERYINQVVLRSDRWTSSLADEWFCASDSDKCFRWRERRWQCSAPIVGRELVLANSSNFAQRKCVCLAIGVCVIEMFCQEGSNSSADAMPVRYYASP